MAERVWWTKWIASVCVLQASFCVIAAPAEHLLATVDQPAVVTARLGAASGPEQASRLVLTVVGFAPPREGAVEVVVSAGLGSGGADAEIGRFGIFPSAPFKVEDAAQGRRYGFPLPSALASADGVTVQVRIVPIRGDGKGASLELGGADIR